MEFNILDLNFNDLIQPSNSILLEITRKDTNESYTDIFKQYIAENIPFVLENATEGWNSKKKWVSNDEIDYEYLSQTYGERFVPVVDCGTVKYNSHNRSDMRFNDFIDFIKNRNEESQVIYLKDWHLKRHCPDSDFYTVPKYFASDWLNEYCTDRGEDDFMFVYFGPKDSWTPFHADVYASFSWSANVIGEKEWYIFPPGEERKLESPSGDLLMDVRTAITSGNNIQYLRLIQRSGDAIFIPSGWHHQVHNLRDTISINHNWVNGCNIAKSWDALQHNFNLVKKESAEFTEMEEREGIADSEDWEVRNELILKSLFGMDHTDFFKFVMHIAEKRLKELKSGSYVEFDNWCLGRNQIIFDLKCVDNLIRLVQQTYDVDGVVLEEFCKIQDEIKLIESFRWFCILACNIYTFGICS